MTNERRIYTADEARALREGRESTGAWDAGAGDIYAGHDTCPRHRGDAANQRIRCECRAVGAVDGDGDRALAAAAPDLAASVEHYAAENARLRAALREYVAADDAVIAAEGIVPAFSVAFDRLRKSIAALRALAAEVSK